jgi:hypothetical protein
MNFWRGVRKITRWRGLMATDACAWRTRFGQRLGHKKASFAILSDQRYAGLFTDEEIEVFRRHIPWTRRVRESETSFAGQEQNLIALIRDQREQFVLKPNDDYGGHGVFLGWETSPKEWDEAILLALTRRTSSRNARRFRRSRCLRFPAACGWTKCSLTSTRFYFITKSKARSSVCRRLRF